MIRIENEDIHGWEVAIRAMRNSHNSWDKSDSVHRQIYEDYYICDTEFIIGPNDLDLMKRLAKAGDDESKFMRFIDVTIDITAPLYWWKQFDQYKVATVSSSTSTMHSIDKKKFTLDDFSIDKIESIDSIDVDTLGYTDCSLVDNWIVAKLIVEVLNFNREKYLETKDKKYWWQMIQLLPESYNQLRTIKLNYQVLRNIYHARKNHKLDEWKEFCKWIESLPYSELITEV